MGYLVRQYCTEEGLCKVPGLLRFRWAGGKGKQNRNPSVGSLKFPRLSYTPNSGPRTWAKCNIRAAWILGEVCGVGKFGDLVPRRQLRALEAALFMIGYDLPAST